MAERRRQYNQEFKTEAVELVLKRGKPAVEIAGDISIRSFKPSESAHPGLHVQGCTYELNPA